MWMTMTEVKASELHEAYGGGTIEIMRAYGIARDRGLDRQTAWWAVEEWLKTCAKRSINDAS